MPGAVAVHGVVEHRVDAAVLRRRIEAERMLLGRTVAELATRLEVRRQLRAQVNRWWQQLRGRALEGTARAVGQAGLAAHRLALVLRRAARRLDTRPARRRLVTGGRPTGQSWLSTRRPGLHRREGPAVRRPVRRRTDRREPGQRAPGRRAATEPAVRHGPEPGTQPWTGRAPAEGVGAPGLVPDDRRSRGTPGA